MESQDPAAARAQAVNELAEKEGRSRQDAEYIVDSLAAGLSQLADTFFARVYLDVQRAFGQDSMMLRALAKSELSGKNEIDLYVVAESAQTAVEHALVKSGAAWYAQWLAAYRLAETAATPAAQKRLSGYADLPSD